MTPKTGDDPDFLNDPDDLAWVAFGMVQAGAGRLESKRGSVIEARFQSLLKKSQRARRQADADRGEAETTTRTKKERQP